MPGSPTSSSSRGAGRARSRTTSTCPSSSRGSSRRKTRGRELAIVQKISALVSMAYVRQKEALGLGHAVSVAEPLVGDNPFAVLLGDDLVASEVPCIAQMIEVYDRVRAPVLAVMRVPREQISSYGVIEADDQGGGLHRVKRLVEKPRAEEAPSDLAIIGRYILVPEIFAHLASTASDERGEIQLTNALESLLADTPIYGFEFEGNPSRLREQARLPQGHGGIRARAGRPGDSFREYLRSLVL